ncbi:MAG: hypothetical protein WKG00_03665 [Polyangiaceae bacterium]
MEFVTIGEKLKSSAEECNVYILFDSEPSTDQRSSIAAGVPECLSETVEWSGQLLHLDGGLGFRPLMRKAYKTTAAFDVAFAAVLARMDKRCPIALVVNDEGKGTVPTAKKLAEALTARALPRLQAQALAHPAEANAWLATTIGTSFNRGRLDPSLFAALAATLEACAAGAERNTLARLLTVYLDLASRAPGTAPGGAHSPGFRLALLLAEPALDAQAIAGAAPSVEGPEVAMVNRAAVWRLTAGSTTTEERAATARALAESPSLRHHRATDKDSIPAALSGVADGFLFPFSRERTPEDIAAASQLLDAAVLFDEAPDNALVNQLCCLVATGRSAEAAARADAVQPDGARAPLLHVFAAAAYVAADRVADALTQLQLAEKRGVDVGREARNPALRALHENAETAHLVRR